MDTANLGELAYQALRLALWISAPVLLASVLAGLVTGVLQAATQVQDAALSFVPRLLAVAVALFVAAPWIGESLVTFTTTLWRQMPRLLL